MYVSADMAVGTDWHVKRFDGTRKTVEALRKYWDDAMVCEMS